MTEFNEKELGEKLAALCNKAKTDLDLQQRIISDPLSVLHAEGIEFPENFNAGVIGFINAALFQINQPLNQIT